MKWWPRWSGRAARLLPKRRGDTMTVVNRVRLSEAQQSVLSKISAGAKLHYSGEPGRFRLRDAVGERTVFPNTAQSLLRSGHLSMRLDGECVLAKLASGIPVVDGTPPPDLPAKVIVMDREFAKRHPTKAFYLRIGSTDGHVETVRLDDQVTPIGARRAAQALGHEPSHWMEVADGILCRF